MLLEPLLSRGACVVSKDFCVSDVVVAEIFGSLGSIPEMTYKVLSGTLNLCSLTHTARIFSVVFDIEFLTIT